MSLDLTAIRKEWLNQCGPCDYGLTEMGCACPKGDYRSIVVRLADEVERLTKAVGSQTAVANAALVGSARRQAELDRLRAGINDTVAALRAAAMAEDGQPDYGFATGLNDGLQLATARLRALLDGPR